MFTHFLHIMFVLLMCTFTPSLSISPIHSGTRQWTCANLIEPYRPDAVHTVVCTRSGGESVLFAVSISLAKTEIFVLLLVGFNSVVRTQIFLVNIHFKAFGAICGWQNSIDSRCVNWRFIEIDFSYVIWFEVKSSWVWQASGTTETGWGWDASIAMMSTQLGPLWNSGIEQSLKKCIAHKDVQ